MPPILFPSSTAPGKDAIESAGRLVNAYAEKMQPGAPGQQIIRRAPGLTLFSDSDQSAIRGLWYDGSTAVYAAYTSALTWSDSTGTETVIGSIPDGAIAFSGTFGSTTDASSYSLAGVPFGDASADRRIVVGLSQMEYAGTELITNGGFTSNLSGWTAGAGWTWDASGYALFTPASTAELIVNGTFASSLTGWTAGNYTWTSGRAILSPYIGTNDLVNGTFNTDLSGWTMVDDGGGPPAGGAWVWATNPVGIGYARCISPAGVLSGQIYQTFFTYANTTYQIGVTPVLGVPGSTGTIYVYVDGALVHSFAATAGAQAFNIAGTGGYRTLHFRAVISVGAFGIDDVSATVVAVAGQYLQQSSAIFTAAGTNYTFTITPQRYDGASSGTLYATIDGGGIAAISSTAGPQSYTVAGSGTNRTFGGYAAPASGAIGFDDMSLTAIAVVTSLTQAFATTAGVTYKLSVTSGGVGTVNITVDGSVIASFAAASGGTTITLAGSGTTRTLGFIAASTVGAIGIDNVSLRAVSFALPTAVSIGGIAATSVASNSGVALWVANVPTGTSGTVALTYAQTMNEASVVVWRLNSVASDTPSDTAVTGPSPSTATVDVSVGSVSVFLAQNGVGFHTGSGVSLDTAQTPSTYINYSAFSGGASAGGVASVTSTTSANIVGATWAGATGSGLATFAKNNKVPDPDQLLCVSGIQLVPFTKLAIGAEISVNSEIPTSVCFGEGYFFVTTALGRCYASAINDTTFNSLDSIRAEQRPESLTRGVFVGGELLLFGPSHTEVWASRGNPNPTGFPLKYVTSIPRGIIGTLAVTGYEEGFEGGLFWVADDNSVRMLQGYQPKTISPPALERAIALCTTKSNIRMMCYDVDGHACVVVDICGESTWAYDITEGGLWHERSTADEGYWRATGNSVRAFDKWICGDHDTGNLYQVDDRALNDGGEEMPFIVESIAMEAFPSRLKVSRAEFNFISGVGNAAVPNPELKISWSDTGGHRWTDPLIRRLGEDGRYYEQARVNGLGLTGVKGRRFRLRVDDEVEVGLLAGSMDVASLK